MCIRNTILKKIFFIASFLIFLCLFIWWSKNHTKSLKNTDDSIKVWHWMTDRHSVFKQLGERYFKETGHKVIFELNAPSNLYSAKIRTAAQTNNLPDIFGVLGGKQELASYIQAGLVTSLTDPLMKNNSSWESVFLDKALNTTRFYENNRWGVLPGYYGIPIDFANIQMIYNKDIFAEIGITKIPRTWDEFIKTGELVIAKTNKEFFIAGLGETWIIRSLIRNLAYNMLGKERYLQTIRGEFSYNSKEWIEVFYKIKEMADKGLFAVGVVTMINKKAERLFTTGRAAVSYNGSWCVNVYKGMNPDMNYGTMFFPTVNPENPTVIQGGAGSSFIVSGATTKKRETIDFLKWLTSKEIQVFLSLKTVNLPSNIDAIRELPPNLNQFAKRMTDIIHPDLMPVMEEAEVKEVLAKEVQLLIIKSKGVTPESVAEKVAALKEK